MTRPRVLSKSARSTGSMALGNLLSRLTGVGRLVALAWALGITASADAYNLANTTPNIIHDMVVGGIATATFVPVFVQELTRKNEDAAMRSISAVVSLSGLVLLTATGLGELLAPELIRLYLVANHRPEAAKEAVIGTTFLRWFMPQVLCYGFVAISTALLNTKRRFAAPAFAPVATNLFTIALLLLAAHLARDPSLSRLSHDTGLMVLIGLGTTVGIALQAIAVIPSLLRSGIRLRWRLSLSDPAVRAVARLSKWILGVVILNQLSLFAILALAASLEPGSVSAYTYAYTFFQMPIAVIATSVVGVLVPELSEQWARGRTQAFANSMAKGLRALMTFLIPGAIGLLLLAKPAMVLLLGHGVAHISLAHAPAALAMFALGLPGAGVFFLCIRALQSMHDTKTVFALYVLENAVKLLLAIALVFPLKLEGLALASSAAYSISGLLGLLLMWKRGVSPVNLATGKSLSRLLVACVPMGVVVAVVERTVGASSGLELLLRLTAAILTGLATFGLFILAGTALEGSKQ